MVRNFLLVLPLNLVGSVNLLSSDIFLFLLLDDNLKHILSDKLVIVYNFAFHHRNPLVL